MITGDTLKVLSQIFDDLERVRLSGRSTWQTVGLTNQSAIADAEVRTLVRVLGLFAHSIQSGTTLSELRFIIKGQ